jgi:hypothetical protein
MNDILTKLKENWMIVAGVLVAWMVFGGKKGGTRSKYRRRAKSYGRKMYRRLRRR